MIRVIQNMILFLLLIGNIVSFGQHDAAYAQYMFNGLIINPAYAGSNGALNATLSYKNQWTGFNNAPKTSAFGIHSPLKNSSSNVGLLAINDRYGLTTRNRVLASYAYRIKLNNTLNLSFGLQAGCEALRNDYSKLVTIESNDRSFTNLTPNSTYFVSGSGIYLNSDKLFLGISMPVMYSGNMNGLNTYKPVFMYSGYKFKLNSEFSLQPSVLVKYIKGSPVQADFNCLFTYNEKIGIGASYRTNKTIIATAFCQVNKQFLVGYAFENNFSLSFRLPKNSHELVLKYTFGYYKPLKNPVTFY
ncbi:MAG: type IX secretion system membrane protein PorP/SprF [Bacteroidetes bacterium]|nr:type IX secretion system membrane protein PorP/SprF [Bacteroidota bacterium]